jgi:hypothetical protein
VRFQQLVRILSIFFLIAFSCNAQTRGASPTATSSRTSTQADPGTMPTDIDESQRRMSHDMAKKANLERQAQIKNDTEKLLKLSQELKDYVDKSNENMLSLSVLKKAEEIEKLARSVKDKMKGPN